MAATAPAPPCTASSAATPAACPATPTRARCRRSDIIWTEETVARLFEQGPDSFTPGSKMPLQRLPDPPERAALIAFLKTATAPTGTGAKGAKP